MDLVLDTSLDTSLVLVARDLLNNIETIIADLERRHTDAAAVYAHVRVLRARLELLADRAMIENIQWYLDTHVSQEMLLLADAPQAPIVRSGRREFSVDEVVCAWRSLPKPRTRRAFCKVLKVHDGSLEYHLHKVHLTMTRLRAIS